MKKFEELEKFTGEEEQKLQTAFRACYKLAQEALRDNPDDADTIRTNETLVAAYIKLTPLRDNPNARFAFAHFGAPTINPLEGAEGAILDYVIRRVPSEEIRCSIARKICQLLDF